MSGEVQGGGRAHAVVMGAALLGSGDLASLRAAAAISAGPGFRAEQVALALVPVANGAQHLAVSYVLAASPTSILGASAADIPGEERRVLAALEGPATEQLFNWEDDECSSDSRGIAKAMLSAIPLDDSQANEMRALVHEMRDTKIDGLAARARAVGYYREAMALHRTARQTFFLLYLELSNPAMREQLNAYPDTDFTSWWNPRFRALVAGTPLAAGTEMILSWSAQDTGNTGKAS